MITNIEKLISQVSTQVSKQKHHHVSDSVPKKQTKLRKEIEDMRYVLDKSYSIESINELESEL